MCYLGVSLVCLVGLISPSSIVCSDKIVNEDNVIEHGNGLIQGATSRPCTILFMLFFYFSSKFSNLEHSFWTKNGQNQSSRSRKTYGHFCIRLPPCFKLKILINVPRNWNNGREESRFMWFLTNLTFRPEKFTNVYLANASP